MAQLPSLTPAALAQVGEAAEASASTPALVHAVWAIPALPLAALLVLAAFGRRIGQPKAGILATAAMFGSFAASVITWVGLKQLNGEQRHWSATLFSWLPSGGFQVDIGVLVDPLSVVMCLFVTGVGALIFLYSIGYMRDDPDFPKFFLYLSFFALSMLVLVLGNSMLVTFLGWEGVGAASYFLIGYWFQDIRNSSAGKKAFITNRIGDWGFMVAMLFTFMAFGTLNYSGVFSQIAGGGVAQTTLTAVSVLVLIGAIGKSAQGPLYLWLPDAMAGPTPVSALMHAATMVTAGVYLLVRINPIIVAASPWVTTLIAWVGAGTAFFAATVAISQRDIKKVLAYSTISQLAYMVLAVGSGAYVAAIFHMVTHAFFKALLFLGAGAVIHGLNNEQDMDYMGGLRKFMPITAVTFIVAWLAIAGIPPFAGMWSKGEILAFAWQMSPALWVVGFITAGLTAYYMSREVYLVFFGKRRWTEFEGAHGHEHPETGPVAAEETAAVPAGTAAHAEELHPTVDEHGNPLPTGPGAGHHVVHGAPVHPHEAPPTMTIPLIVLAVLATVAGLLGLPFGEDFKVLEHWLEPSVAAGEGHLTVAGSLQAGLEIATIVLAIIGIAVAAGIYLRKRREDQIRFEPAFFDKAWYYDLGISSFMAGPGMRFFNWVTYWFDRYVIDGPVNGMGRLIRLGGGRLRHAQSGYVRNYALAVACGTIILVGYVIARARF